MKYFKCICSAAAILMSVVHHACATDIHPDSYARFVFEELHDGVDALFGKLPFSVETETYFMSHWIDEGANVAPHGMNIHQYYRGFFSVDALTIGYEYFQADFEHSQPHTLERDHTVFLEFNIDKITFSPVWTYVDIPHEYGDDSGELGIAVSADIFLNPSFAFNYDYDDAKGFYFEWNISHEFLLEKNGKTVAFLTPSVTLGLDADKASENTTLTHLDFGIECTAPITNHLLISGFIHFTKGFKPSEGFESVVPWGGFALYLAL